MGGSGGGYTPSGSNTECRRLEFQANLNSPQAAIAALNVGDLLPVVLQQRVVTVLHNGSPIGSITGPRIQRLVSCIENGYSYEAEVVFVSGGTCAVMVRCDE
ncbi:hypothetical protein [Vibrio sp. VPAP30]|uniref:hypothetical protein n=1 Tax=Vibrio sp. VPAP30 TaxID=1647102 RepID=UPI0006580911|nr:hypothetical protein [Vibrio sp. VPAP30]KLN64476.1 hypothetical protein ZX61_14420 [Vibrio sp. VPAP30]